MEKGLENRSRNAEPIFVVFHSERLTRSVINDLLEPFVEFPIGGKCSKFLNDSQSALLQQIHFEALMIESINVVLIDPVAHAFVEQRFEFRQCCLESVEKALHFRPII